MTYTQYYCKLESRMRVTACRTKAAGQRGALTIPGHCQNFILNLSVVRPLLSVSLLKQRLGQVSTCTVKSDAWILSHFYNHSDTSVTPNNRLKRPLANWLYSYIGMIRFSGTWRRELRQVSTIASVESAALTTTLINDTAPHSRRP